jgi:TRAP-type C4-dicarboxylate transport system permease small subunit
VSSSGEGAPVDRSPPEGTGLDLLRRLVGAFDRGVRAAVVVALVGVLVFTVGQVPDRYVFKSSFSAYDQFSRLALVWLTFLGIAIGVRERANIRIELLEHFLPPRLTRALSVLLDLVVLVSAILVVVVGWRLLEVGSYQAIIGTPFTYEIVYGGLLLGMALLALFLVFRVLDVFAGGRLGLDKPASGHDPA